MEVCQKKIGERAAEDQGIAIERPFLELIEEANPDDQPYQAKGRKKYHRRCDGENAVAVIDMGLSYRVRVCPRGALALRDSRPEWLAFTAQLAADWSPRRRAFVKAG
jgi:hypothetical protein